MAGGRPTLYEGENTLAKVEQFLKECVDYPDENGKTIVNFPSTESLANAIDVSVETLYEWSRVHPEFSEMFRRVMKEQAKRLLNSGLGGQYNANIAKLVLSKHGYRDESAIDHSNKGEKFEAGELSPAMVALTKEYEERMKKALLE